MDRRSFFKTAAVAGAATATGLASPAIAQGVKQIRMVTSWPKNFPGLGTAANKFAEIVTRSTDGRYEVKVYGGGELVHPLKCHDAVEQGTADAYHSAEYYYGGKSAAYPFFATVPFGFTANEMEAWIRHGGGQELWDELSAQFNIKPFLGGNTGSQMGGWFKNPIRSVEDLKGLKMRIPGLGGAVINALGGTTVTLAGSEIMPALQAGTIDGTEWVGPWNDLAFGFYKVTKFYHYPGFHEPGAAQSIGLSKTIWDGMSDADKAVIESAAGYTNGWGLAQFNANNNQALETLINKHGVELIEFSDEIFKEMGTAAKQVLADAGNTDDMSKKVYDSFMDFRKKAVAWTKLSDQAYTNKRELTPF